MYNAKEAGALCDECPLNDKIVVPSSGPLTARLAVVGEGPGFHEEKEGIPFVPHAPSGRMLTDLLKHNGVDRESVFVTNATLCLPPRFKVGRDEVVDDKKLRAALNCCLPRLERELKSLKKLRCVIPLGALAVKAVTGRKNLSIGTSRGFVWTGEKIRKKDPPFVVPAYHPAAVLRAPAWEPIIANDFDRAIRAMKGTLDIRGVLKPESIVMAPKIGEISGVLSRLGKKISVDIETTREGPTECSLLCIGISDGKLHVLLPWAKTSSTSTPYYGARQASVAHKFKRAIEDRVIVTHNGPNFDQIVMRREADVDLEYDSAGWEDTLLAHHTFAAHLPQRLDHVVSMYCDTYPWKITARKPARVSDEKGAWDPVKLEDEELWLYCLIDCALTIDSWERMQDDLSDEQSVYAQDKITASFCRRMQEQGIWVDAERRRALRAEFIGRQNKLLGLLRAQAGYRFSPTKLADLRKILFRILKAPVLWRSIKTGVPSTNVNTLTALAQMDTAAGRFARLLLKWRSAWKTRSTYVDGIDPEEDGRVHPSWRAWGTVSGRLACRTPNLMNLTRGSVVRSMYAAPEGRSIVGFDFSQLEMRIAAYLSGDPNLIAAVESEDVHAVNAEVLFGKLPPKDDPSFKKIRHGGKEAGFAIAYLAGVETVHARMVAQGLKVDLIHVKTALNRLHERYHHYFEWQEGLLKEVMNRGYLRLHRSGRFCWFGHVPLAQDVANRPIQGGAADIVNEILPEIEDNLPEDAHFVAQVHDAGYIECPTWKAQKIAGICKSIAERPLEIEGRSVVFPVEVKVGKRLSEVS